VSAELPVLRWSSAEMKRERKAEAFASTFDVLSYGSLSLKESNHKE